MTQWLILHKVRGEAKFDCAEPVCPGNGEPCQPKCGNWMNGKCLAADEWITNAGHRAYPHQKWHIEDLMDVSTDEPICPNNNQSEAKVPDDWPEHFQVTDAPAKKGKGLNLMDFITLPPPRVKLVRRRI